MTGENVHLRVAVLVFTAFALLAVGFEFGVVSPWRGTLRQAAAELDRWTRRLTWNPPCVSDVWRYVGSEDAVVPIPGCFRVETETIGDDRRPIVVAWDPESPETVLVASVHPVTTAWIQDYREQLPSRAWVSVLRDDDVLIWSSGLEELHVVANGVWLSASQDQPTYLERRVRQRESGRVVEVAQEFLRMRGHSWEPDELPWSYLAPQEEKDRSIETGTPAANSSARFAAAATNRRADWDYVREAWGGIDLAGAARSGDSVILSLELRTEEAARIDSGICTCGTEARVESYRILVAIRKCLCGEGTGQPLEIRLPGLSAGRYDVVYDDREAHEPHLGSLTVDGREPSVRQEDR